MDQPAVPTIVVPRFDLIDAAVLREVFFDAFTEVTMPAKERLMTLQNEQRPSSVQTKATWCKKGFRN